MAATNPTGRQILDHTVQRDDMDVSTVGNAMITKVIQGTGISMSSTGADAGTGDVTISSTAGSPPVTIMSGMNPSDVVVDQTGDYVTVG